MLKLYFFGTMQAAMGTGAINNGVNNTQINQSTGHI